MTWATRISCHSDRLIEISIDCHCPFFNNSGQVLFFLVFYECYFLVLFQASEDISKMLVLIKNIFKNIFSYVCFPVFMSVFSWCYFRPQKTFPRRWYWSRTSFKFWFHESCFFLFLWVCFPGVISGLRRHFQDAGTDQEHLLNSGFMSLVFFCFYECVFLVLFQASEDISKTLTSHWSRTSFKFWFHESCFFLFLWVCFPGVISGLRRHFQDAGTDQEHAVWHGWPGASDWAGGPASSGDVQLEYPHHTCKWPIPDWFWGRYRLTLLVIWFSQKQNWDYVWRRNVHQNTNDNSSWNILLNHS